MIENVLSALASSTPSLRQRYLERVREVASPEARELEAKIMRLIEADVTRAA